jgi:hypothetical protein
MEHESVVSNSPAPHSDSNETLRWRLFDLACDLKMLMQLHIEQEVGFPTPEDEDVPPILIIETAEEHLRYLAVELGLDPSCPAPSREHLGDDYPLGEGRLSKTEYEDRRGKLPTAHVEVEEELEGPLYFNKCSAALQRGDEDAAKAIIEEAAKDDVIRRILSDGEDVLLFADGSWFDVNLCLELYTRRTNGT